MNSETSVIMSPLLQYGFAGFSIVLLGVLVWLIRELLSVLKENNRVIAENTQAIIAVDKNTTNAFEIMGEIKDELLKRPCIAEFKQG